jgi:dolichol-phosphate mannosyltransferase
MNVSVVIPTYNEAKNITRLVKTLKDKLKKYKFEIIVVDDQSTDGTLELLRKLSLKDTSLVVISTSHRKGLGKSILLGILKARGAVIVGMDADFNHNPQDITKLIEKTKKYDLVVASRFVKGGGMKEIWRYYSSLIFNFGLKYLLGFPVFDNTSGYYAIKKNVLNKLDPERIYAGYGDYEIRLSWYAKLKKCKIAEIPTLYGKRKEGKSKSNLWKMLFDYTIIAVKLRIFENK